MEDIPKITVEYLLTNGVLGLTTLLSLAAAAYFYKGREQDRREYLANLEKLDREHRMEVAQWVKLHLDLQNERLDDQKTQTSSISQSMDLLKTLFDAATRGGRLEKVS